MAKTRASKDFLVEPAATQTHSPEQRAAWLGDARATFVSSTPVNKLYYGWILERLWPEGSGIPGPHVTEDEIRAHLNVNRATIGKTDAYKDVFRRVRELQGEEGFTSIVKEGVRYQLQSLTRSQKRPPRAAPPPDVWQRIKQHTGNRCANCGRQEPDVQLSADHRVPRSRYAGPPEAINAEENLQALCEQCNNTKSTQCRGCEQNCQTCAWAYPERYRPIQVVDENREQLRRAAEREGTTAEELANRILRDHFNARRR